MGRLCSRKKDGRVESTRHTQPFGREDASATYCSMSDGTGGFSFSLPGASSFTFGAPVPPATGGFSFGPAAPAPATPAPATTGGFSFGGGAPAPATPSAAPAAPAAPFGSAPTSSAFTFGGGSASPAPFGGGSATPAPFGGGSATPAPFGSGAPAPFGSGAAAPATAAFGSGGFGSGSTPAAFGSGGAAAPAPFGGFGTGGASTPGGFGTGGASAPAASGAGGGGGFTFSGGGGGGGGGFSFSGGGAPPAAFGSANKGKYKKEDISLVTAADVEPIASALRASPPERLELIGAPVDCEETPTVSDAAAPALAEALKSCKASLRSVKLKNHRFESDAAMSTVLGALCGCTVLEELDLTNSSLKEAGGRHATPSQSKAGH